MADGITNVQKENGTCTIFLTGKIDAANYEAIRDEAIGHIEEDDVDELVFDMDEVVFVSSAGLRMFSSVNQRIAELEKDYMLVNLREDMMKFFQMTGYSSAFCIKLKEE